MLPPGIREYYVNYGKLTFAVDGEHTDKVLTRMEMEAVAPFIRGAENAVHLCCGAGRHVTAFALSGIRSVGLDISPFLVRFGWDRIRRMGLEGRCGLLLGDTLSPPFADASARVVTLLGNCFSLFDAENARRIIAEADRIARPDGRFIIDIPDPEHAAALFSGKVTLTGSVETEEDGEVFWEWTRYVDGGSGCLVSRETIFRKEAGRHNDRKVHVFRFRLYTPESAAELVNGGSYRLRHREHVVDTSGRYRGLLKKRYILCFQKYG